MPRPSIPEFRAPFERRARDSGPSLRTSPRGESRPERETGPETRDLLVGASPGRKPGKGRPQHAPAAAAAGASRCGHAPAVDEDARGADATWNRHVQPTGAARRMSTILST